MTEDLAVKNKCLAITPGTPYDLGSRMEYMYDEHEPQAHMAQIRARAHDPKAYLTTLLNLWCLSHHTLTQHMGTYSLGPASKGPIAKIRVQQRS